MLTFKEKGHLYLKNQVPYSSVSSVIDLYKQPFDTEFWSTYKALEKLIGKEEFRAMRRHRDWKSPAFIEWACLFVDRTDLLKETANIQRKWQADKEKSLQKGNAYHARKEDQAYNKGYELNPYTREKVTTMAIRPQVGKDKKSQVADLYALADGYYPELMMWNNDHQIAGTADKVFIYSKGKTRYVDLDDYKTNKEIVQKNRYDKMRPPLNSLDDCNYNHYRLQICLYGWMLEQFGFKVNNVGFSHLNQMYAFSYGKMKRHIINMLEDYAKLNGTRTGSRTDTI